MESDDRLLMSLFHRIDTLETIAGWIIAQDERSSFTVDGIQLMQKILLKDRPVDPDDLEDIDKQFDNIMMWVEYFTRAKAEQASTDSIS